MSSRRARQWIVDAAAIFTLLLFAIPVWLILAQQDHLSSNGITTTGIVQNKTFARGGNDNSPDWFISYAFKDATGHEHVGSSRVDASFFNRVSPGETLTIEYLADQPGTSRIARAATFGTGTPEGAIHTPGKGLPKPASSSAPREASRSAAFAINRSSKRPVQSGDCGL